MGLKIGVGLGWRDGTLISEHCFSFRRFRFGSKFPHGGLYPSIAKAFFPLETLEFGAWSVGWLFLVVNLTLSGMSYNPDKEGILMIWFLRQEDNVPLILDLEAG